MQALFLVEQYIIAQYVHEPKYRIQIEAITNVELAHRTKNKWVCD